MKRHKYHAQPTVIDGIRFDSKAEARRYQDLRLLERAGEIRGLELQPSFDLCVPTGLTSMSRVGRYRADFAYEAVDRASGVWRRVIEDVKGMRTETYRLKKRMVEAQYGVEITEVAA